MKDDLEKLRISKDQRTRRPSGRSPWPWIVLILILLLAGGATFLKLRNASAAPTVQTLRVRAPDSAAAPADLVSLNATGYIIAAHKIEVASKVIGRVAWVGVEMGDKVKQGDVIVRLEDDEFRARVGEAQGQLDSAKARLAELKDGPRPQEIAQAQAQLDQAKIDLETAKRNYSRLATAAQRGGDVSKTEVDDAQALTQTRQAQVDYAKEQLSMLQEGSRKEQISAQEATVAQLESVLAQAKIDLDNTIIRAPIDGTILERNVERGEFVTNGFVGDRGAKGYVVSLANLRDLLVELDINQNDFAKVSQNQPCWITTDAYPDRKYDGKVELISPVANRQKATIQVRVRALQPDDYLKPDMNASVAFLSPQKPATQPGAGPAAAPPIVIPADALREGAVFIVEDGKARRIPVTTGMNTANGNIEILKGLLGGEDLIIHPPETLKNGDRVSVQDHSG